MKPYRYIIITFLVLLNTRKVIAQAPWIAYPFRDPTGWHFVPYVPPTSTPTVGSLVAAQQKASSGIVFLALNNQNESLGTGFLIKTDPSKPYVCMLTAGHVIESIYSVSGTPSINNILNVYMAYGYLRNGTEFYLRDSQGNLTLSPPNGNNNLSAVWQSNAPIRVLEYNHLYSAKTDWAIVGVPRSSIPFGLSINELPVEFPTTLSTTNGDKFFSIHHAIGYPQRLSVLPNNAYTSITDVGTGNVQWKTQFWSDGGLEYGASGSPLLKYSTGKDPVAIGINVGVIGFLNSGSAYNGLPQATRDLLENDESAWISYSYKLSNISAKIETYCGSQGSNKEVIKIVPSTKPIIKAGKSFSRLADIVAGSTSIITGTTATYRSVKNWGDVSMNNFQLSGYNFVISALAGVITLGDGFTVIADALTSLDIGLEGEESGTQSAARQAVEVPESVDRTDGRFLVFPNPTNGEVNIQPTVDMGGYQVRIMDNQGRVVYEDSVLQEGARHINLKQRNISAGRYILQILLQDKAPSSHALVVQ